MPITRQELHSSLDAEIEKIGSLSGTVERALDYYWKAELQPPARTDRTGWFINAFAIKYQDIIDRFETLRLANTDYITRKNMGKEQSGTYDFWRYQFTPKSYKKTVIITSAVHGSEVTTIVAMLRFFHYLVNEWNKYPELAEIRENVRIIYIPSANPWGTSQPTRTRYNSRGVDLNRNFPYLWDEYVSGEPFGHDYKGTEPFSEVETQYIRSTLEEFSDAVVYLDLHNTGSGSPFTYYVPIPQNYPYKTYDKLLAYFTKGMSNPNVNYVVSNKPSAPNYAFNVLGIPASGPEWVDRSFGQSQYDADEVTKALEWLSNVIIEHCREFTTEKPIVSYQYYNHKATPGITINSITDQEITQFYNLLTIPSDGIVVYDGYVTAGLVSGSGSLTITPMLGQTGNGTGKSYYDRRPSEWSNYSQAFDTNNRISIPFTAAIPVKKTDMGVGVVRLGFGLAGKSEATYRILRYRGRLTFIPSDSRNYFEREIII